MELPNDQTIEIEPGLRRMILIELVFPITLLVLGIYHGLVQVLYRAGILHPITGPPSP
jgi:cytochrome c oxidase subunit 1